MNKKTLELIVEKIKKKAVKYDSEFEEYLEEHPDLIQIKFDRTYASYTPSKNIIQLVVECCFFSKQLLTYIMNQIKPYDYTIDFHLEYGKKSKTMIFAFVESK